MKVKNKPLVSVITPTFNAERYISETLHSIINQSYQNIEIIVVDDCSTDKTVEIVKGIVKEHPEIKFMLFYLEENSGAAIARNKAITNANGEYIAFLDSDDLWHADKIVKQIEFMEKNSYLFSYTDYELIDAEGKEYNKIIQAPQYMTYDKLLKNTAIGCLTVMLNIKELGKMQMPNIRAGQDTAYWLSILKKGTIAYNLNENLAMYRKVKGSLSSNKIKALKRTWDIYTKVEEINFVKSTYFFTCYFINALKKRV